MTLSSDPEKSRLAAADFGVAAERVDVWNTAIGSRQESWTPSYPIARFLARATLECGDASPLSLAA